MMSSVYRLELNQVPASFAPIPDVTDVTLNRMNANNKKILKYHMKIRKKTNETEAGFFFLRLFFKVYIENYRALKSKHTIGGATCCESFTNDGDEPH